MEAIIEVITNLSQYIVAFEAMLLAVIAFFLLIPGDQPEKFLQSVVDIIKKISKK